MVIRLVPHRQPLALQFLTALAVDLQAAVDLIDLAVVLKILLMCCSIRTTVSPTVGAR